jgi:hypothetical protein
MKVKLYLWLALALIALIMISSVIMMGIKLLLIPVAIIASPVLLAILYDYLIGGSAKMTGKVTRFYGKGITLLFR